MLYCLVNKKKYINRKSILFWHRTKNGIAMQPIALSILLVVYNIYCYQKFKIGRKAKWPRSSGLIFSASFHINSPLYSAITVLFLTRSHYKGLPEVNDGPQDRKLNPAFRLSRNLMTLRTTLLDGQSWKHGLKKVKTNIAWSDIQLLDSFVKKI